MKPGDIVWHQDRRGYFKLLYTKHKTKKLLIPNRTRVWIATPTKNSSFIDQHGTFAILEEVFKPVTKLEIEYYNLNKE